MIGIVKAKRLNVRASNALDGPQVGQLTAGTVVEIVGWKAGWHEIRYEFRSAYVFSQFVEVHDGPPRRAGITTAASLCVRDRPAASGALLGTLAAGSAVHEAPHAKTRRREEEQKEGRTFSACVRVTPGPSKGPPRRGA